MHNYEGNFFGMHFAWWIFWIVIIIIVYYLINKQVKRKSSDSPLEILKKRLAKGEITKEEFEKLKESLKN